MPRRTLRLILLAFAVSTSFAARADEKTRPADIWDAVFIGNDKVGYVHTLIEPITENGKDVLHLRVETVMNIKRFNQTVQMKLDNSSFETPDGKVLRMDNRGLAGLDTRTVGVAQGDSMVLTLETPGKKSTLTIPWSDDVLGPGA